jgi:hypothetical protein
MATLVFDDIRHNITSLSDVDFWVVNDEGAEVVSKEAGRYQPQ